MSVSSSIDNASAMVNTNNLIKVLHLFDQSGSLQNVNTQFDINCEICLTKKLAVTNKNPGQLDHEVYEPYTILPRCGHAFRKKCIEEWFRSQNFRGSIIYSATCPSCRASVFCPGHGPVLASELGLPSFGVIVNKAFDQAKDIRDLRGHLSQRCILCREEEARSQARLDWIVAERARYEQENQQRAAEAARQAEERRQLEQQQAAQRLAAERRSEAAARADERDVELRELMGRGARLQRRSEEQARVLVRQVDWLRQSIELRRGGISADPLGYELLHGWDQMTRDIRREREARGYQPERWEEFRTRSDELRVLANDRIDLHDRDWEFMSTIVERLEEINQLLRHPPHEPDTDGDED